VYAPPYLRSWRLMWLLRPRLRFEGTVTSFRPHKFIHQLYHTCLVATGAHCALSFLGFSASWFCSVLLWALVQVSM